MEDKKKNGKRLSIEITDDFHTEIKLRATKRNITIRTWVVRALIEQIKREKQYEQ